MQWPKEYRDLEGDPYPNLVQLMFVASLHMELEHMDIHAEPLLDKRQIIDESDPFFMDPTPSPQHCDPLRWLGIQGPAYGLFTRKVITKPWRPCQNVTIFEPFPKLVASVAADPDLLDMSSCLMFFLQLT